MILDLLPSYNFTFVLEKNLEYAKRLFLQFDANAAFSQFAASGVQLESSESINRLRYVGV